MTDLYPLLDPYIGVLEEFFRLVCQLWLERVEEELQAFAEALDAWLHETFAHPRPDWRESFHQLLAEQQAAGRTVTPESRQELVDYLEGWSASIDWTAVRAEHAVSATGETVQPIVAVGAARQQSANRTDEPRRVDQPIVVPDASRPDTKVSTPGPATKPRLPADSRGTWIIGKKGNGVFQFNDSAMNRQAGIVGARIRFKDNFIAKGGFPPEAYYGGSAAEATVTIKIVTALEADNVAADAAMRVKRGDPAWKRPPGYTWHHAGHPGSTTMELVDTKLHAATSHKGPAAELRAARRAAAARRGQKSKTTKSTGGSAEGNATGGRAASHKGARRRIKGKVPRSRGTASAAKPASVGRVSPGKGISGTRTKTSGPTGTGAVSRAMAVAAVYLTAREALQAAGILQPDYYAFTEAQYYFVAEDGSVFIVWSSGWFSRAKREFIAGPRKGQEEKLTKAQFREFQMIAEEQWGKYIPGTIFRQPRFIPGKQRSRIPVIDPERGEVGWIDEHGAHRNPFVR